VKRVHAFAAAVPAALGLAVPATAIAAAIPSAHGKKVSLQQAGDHGTRPQRSATNCALSGTHDCLQVQGNGQFLSKVFLSHWPDKNGGIRIGTLFYTDAVTGHFGTFRDRSESRQPPASYGFIWNTFCHLPHKGFLSGHVTGHSRSPEVDIHSGTLNGNVCSRTAGI